MVHWAEKSQRLALAPLLNVLQASLPLCLTMHPLHTSSEYTVTLPYNYNEECSSFAAYRNITSSFSAPLCGTPEVCDLPSAEGQQWA